MKRQDNFEALRDIIRLTSIDDVDGDVWGMDTNCGHIDNLVKEANKILQKHKLKLIPYGRKRPTYGIKKIKTGKAYLITFGEAYDDYESSAY